MSRILIAHPALSDAATFTASTEDSDYPLAGVQDFDNDERFRTTSSTTQYVVIDLTAVKTFDFIALLFTNLRLNTGTARIRTADTEAGLTAAPDTDTGSFTPIPSGRADDWGYHHFVHKFASDVSNRWIRIDLDDSSHPDGYFEITRAYVSDAFVPDRDVQYGWSIGWIDSGSITRSVSGKAFPYQRPRYRVADFNLAFLTKSAMYDNLFILDRDRGITRDVFVIRNIDDDSQLMSQSIYGTQSELQPVVNDSFSLYSKPFRVEESPWG